MKTSNDLYNFIQASRTDKFGFESFESDGSYFFHFNDKNGKALLFSQKYQSEKGRDRGIISVQKNASRLDRFEKLEPENDIFRFILKAGNNQEIARSRGFETQEIMEKMMKQLANAAKEVIPIHPVENVQAQTASPRQVETNEKVDKSGKFPKYSFRIDWYPEANSGRIEQILTGSSGETKMFKGLDANAILAFLTDHLPNSPLVSEHKPPLPTAKNTNYKPSFSIPEEHLKDIAIKVNGEEVRNHILLHPREFLIEVDLRNEPRASRHNCSAVVFAKSLENFTKIKVGENTTTVTNNGKITVPIHSDLLSPGTYRLMTTVKLDNQPEVLQGSRVIQIW